MTPPGFAEVGARTNFTLLDGASHPAELGYAAAAIRLPDGVPDDIQKRITHEFKLINQLNYAPYFLTVHEVVRFAR